MVNHMKHNMSTRGLTTGITLLITLLFLLPSSTVLTSALSTEKQSLEQPTEPIISPEIGSAEKQKPLDQITSTSLYQADFTVTFPSVTEEKKQADDGSEYTLYSYEGIDFTTQTGAPKLPCKNIWVQIPADATNIKVAVQTHDYTEETLDQKIYPAPELVDTTDSYGEHFMAEKFSYNPSAYEKDELYPASEPVTLLSDFTIRGVHVAEVNAYPILCNPASKTIRSYSAIHATLTYDSIQTKNTCTLYKDDPMIAVLSARIINFQYDGQQDPGHSSLDDGVLHMVSQQDIQNIQTPTFYPDYLIIAAHTFFPSFTGLSPALHDLIEQRRVVDDYNVAIVRLEDIVAFGHGDTTPARIRNFIVDVYTYCRHNANTPELDYLLLLGDADNITNCNQQPWYLPPYEIIRNSEDYAGSPSDLQYSCMGADCLPDIAMGRLPMKTEQDMSNYVSKLLVFENNPPQSPDSWGNRILLMSGNWRWTGSFEDGINGEYDYFRTTTDNLLQSTSSHVQVEEFYADIWGHSHAEQLNAISTFLNFLNDGVFYIGEGGHGDRNGWGFLHVEDNLATILQNTHPTIITSGSCETGHFGWNITDCFDEVWIKSAHGAVGVIGSSIPWGPPIMDRYTITCWYTNHIYREGNVLQYIHFHPSGPYLSMHLLGDPALNVASYATLSSTSPDFSITNANVTYNNQTNNYHADVTVKNVRHANNINTQIGVYYSDVNEGDELYYTTPITIHQNEINTFSFNFPNPMLPGYWGTLPVYFKIDPNNQINELSKTNNVYPTTRSIYVRNFPFFLKNLSEDGFPLLLTEFAWGSTKYGLVKSSPVIADINGDGYDEIIIQTQRNSYGESQGHTGKTYAFTHSGTLLPGWPKNYSGWQYSSPVIGDINNDGHLEIVILEKVYASNDNIHAIHVLDSQGNDLPEFQRTITVGAISSSPVLADINNDGFLEIIYGSSSTGILYVVDHLGNDVPGWPISLSSLTPTHGSYEIFASPAVGDINNDGTDEIVVGCSLTYGRGYLFAFRSTGALFWNDPIASASSTSSRAFANSPVLADLDLDGDLEIAFATELPGDLSVENLRSQHLCIIHHDKTNFTHWPFQIIWHPLWTSRDEGVRAPLTFADLDNNGIPEIIYVIDADSRHEIFIFNTTTGAPFNSNWGYTNDNSWCSPTAKTTIRDAMKGTPVTQGVVVQDINNDGIPEILFGGGCSQLYAYTPAGYLLPGWPISVERFVNYDPKFCFIGSPVIRDIDHDGFAEIVFMSTTFSGLTANYRAGSYLQVLKTTYPFNPAGVEWGMEGGNGGRTRKYQRTLTPTDSLLSILPKIPAETFLRLKHGTYNVNHALTIPPGVNLVGENSLTTIIQSQSGWEHPYPAIITIGASLLANFKVNNSPQGIQINDQSTPILRNLRFSNSVLSAVLANGGGEIEQCIFSDSGNGILANVQTSHLQLIRNTFMNNNNGLFDLGSHPKSLVVFGNYFYNNGYGIMLYGSSANTIRGNTLTDNTYGTLLDAATSNNNITSNNYFSNTHQASDAGTNHYDNGLSGNYWTDYTGTDANGDGIGDTPYSIPNGQNHDHRPLISSLVDSVIVYADIPSNSDTFTLVQFSGYVSGGSTPYTWHWDFGDGNTSWDQNPGHIYNEDHIYSVTLTVVDDEGFHDSYTSQIRIHGHLLIRAGGPYYQLINTPLQFTGYATGGAPPYTWHWDFGDGHTSTIQSPAHTYTATRYFTVNLTVHDSRNNVTWVTANITIADPSVLVYVDDDFTSDVPGWQMDRFNLIQDGINAVSSHGTVLVSEGTYSERLSITHTMNLIGEKKDTTILEGWNGLDTGISVTANYVNISDFTIDYYNIGVRLTNNAYCTIFNTNITNMLEYGVRCVSAHDNKFYFNNFIGSSQNAYAPLYNIWDEGSVYGNYWDDYTGVDLYHGVNQNIPGPDGIGDTPYFVPGVVHGLNQDYYPRMHPYPYTLIAYVDEGYTTSTPGWGCDKFNTIQAGITGVSTGGTVYVASGNYPERISIGKSLSLIGNGPDSTIIDGTGRTILISISSNYTNVTGFTIKNSTSLCFILNHCRNNRIYENTFLQNNRVIVLMAGSHDNMIYHNNFIGNDIPVFLSGTPGVNVWDNGYPSGGNYWDSHPNPLDQYHGTNQNILGSDGIIDLGAPNGGLNPYVISASNQDHYPLLNVYGPVVNINTNKGFSTIQAAINAPDTINGQTIFVRNGIYKENICVTKSITLRGQDKDRTIIKSPQPGNGIFLGATGVRLNGFTVQGNGTGIGIVINSSTANITGTIITRFSNGLSIGGASSNNIISDTVISNTVNGIVFASPTTGNRITRNTISSSTQGTYGIHIQYSQGNIITENTISRYLEALYLHTTANNNEISKNTFAHNGYGIYSDRSVGNNIKSNIFLSSTQAHAYEINGINQWSSNYWDDYSTYYQPVDADRNGIWDTPYAIHTNGPPTNFDYLPLVTPYNTIVHVLTPNGGETWYYTPPTHIIRWESTGFEGELVNIYLEKQGSTDTLIASNIINHAGMNIYQWVMMPPYPPEGHAYIIKIIVITMPNAPQDTSDECFTICSPPAFVQVITPNGGEVWVIGSTQTVRWESHGMSTKVILSISSNGKTWIPIGTSPNTEGTNKYLWKISKTLPPSSKYLLKIESADPKIPGSDISDSVFTLK
jgi:parallel beta-helix repeat protein